MPVVRVNGIDIWYELRGDGPTLALSHGWIGPTEDWPASVFDLAKHVRLLVYDVRGQGRTTAPEDPDAYSLPIYAQDLRALLDELDIEQAHIAGVSQGGMISAQFAVDFPERTRSLVLSDSTAGNGQDKGPGGEWERTIRGHFEMMEHIAVKYGLADLCERRIAYDAANDPHLHDHPDPLEERQAQERRRYARLSLHAFVGTVRAIHNRPDLTARIRELRMPALVIVGEWDGFRPCAERDHKLIEGSRFVLMRRAGHATDRWRQDAFVPTIARFVADVEAGRDVAGEFEL
ncbi:MAG: alpha/beta hydrolase [Dehalococcoidia bacterium]